MDIEGIDDLYIVFLTNCLFVVIQRAIMDGENR